MMMIVTMVTMMIVTFMLGSGVLWLLGPGSDPSPDTFPLVLSQNPAPAGLAAGPVEMVCHKLWTRLT